MPKMIPMQALVAFPRKGRTVQPGETFTALPIEAASLRYNKKAAFVRPTTPAQPGLQTRALEPADDDSDNSAPVTSSLSGVSESPQSAAGRRRAAARNRPSATSNSEE